MQAIIFGNEKPQYVDINVTLFDMTGISETNLDLCKRERKNALEQMFPQSVLADYENYSFPISQIKRLKRHPWAYRLMYFVERCLFKMEKWKNRSKSQQQWN